MRDIPGAEVEAAMTDDGFNPHGSGPVPIAVRSIPRQFRWLEHGVPLPSVKEIQVTTAAALSDAFEILKAEGFEVFWIGRDEYGHFKSAIGQMRP